MLYMIAMKDWEIKEHREMLLYDTITKERKWFPEVNIKNGLKLGNKIENLELNSDGEIVGSNGALTRYTQVHTLDKNGEKINCYVESNAIVILGNIGKDKHIGVDYNGNYITFIDNVKYSKYKDIANGKWVDYSICSIRGEYPKFNTTIIDKEISRLRIVNSKYTNKSFRIDKCYEILLGAIDYEDNTMLEYYYVSSGFEYSCGIKRTAGPMKLNDFRFKSNLYSMYEPENAFTKQGRKVVVPLEFDKKKKLYDCHVGYESRNCLKKVSPEFLIIHKYIGDYIIDAEIKELEDAWMIKTYFNEIYFKKEYAEEAINRYKKIRTLNNKLNLVGGGAYKVNESGVLLKYTPSDKDNTCIIGDNIKEIDSEAFEYKDSRKIKLNIKNEKVKVKKLGKANIELLNAPDKILEQLYKEEIKLKKKGARSRDNTWNTSCIELSKRNSYKGYKLAVRLLENQNEEIADNICGVIKEDVANEIMQDTIKEFITGFNKNKEYDAGLEYVCRSLYKTVNNLKKLGVYEVAKKYLDALSKNLDELVINTDYIVHKDKLIKMNLAEVEDIKVPSIVRVIGHKSIISTIETKSLDLNKTKVIEDRGINIRNIGDIQEVNLGDDLEVIQYRGLKLTCEHITKIVGGKNVKKFDGTIQACLMEYFIKNCNKLEYIETSTHIRGDWFKKGINKIGGMLVKSSSEYIDGELINGEKMPKLFLDDITNRRLVIPEQFGFSARIHDVDSVEFYTLKDISDKCVKLIIDGAKWLNISFYGTSICRDLVIKGDRKLNLVGNLEMNGRILSINCPIGDVSNCELYLNSGDVLKIGEKVGEDGLKKLIQCTTSYDKYSQVFIAPSLKNKVSESISELSKVCDVKYIDMK